MHTIMVADSIATAAETGIQTANQHHGIIILATTKVKQTKQKKERTKTFIQQVDFVLYVLFSLHFTFPSFLERENKENFT